MTRNDRSSASTSCSVPDVRVSSYQWSEETWRSEAAREQLVATAEELCLDRVYVDITGAALAVGDDRSLLATDVVDPLQQRHVDLDLATLEIVMDDLSNLWQLATPT